MSGRHQGKLDRSLLVNEQLQSLEACLYVWRAHLLYVWRWIELLFTKYIFLIFKSTCNAPSVKTLYLTHHGKSRWIQIPGSIDVACWYLYSAVVVTGQVLQCMKNPQVLLLHYLGNVMLTGQPSLPSSVCKSWRLAYGSVREKFLPSTNQEVFWEALCPYSLFLYAPYRKTKLLLTSCLSRSSIDRYMNMLSSYPTVLLRSSWSSFGTYLNIV